LGFFWDDTIVNPVSYGFSLSLKRDESKGLITTPFASIKPGNFFIYNAGFTDPICLKLRNTYEFRGTVINAFNFSEMKEFYMAPNTLVDEIPSCDVTLSINTVG
jgi:hypothetical protein